MAKQIDLKIGPLISTLRDPTPVADVCAALNEVFILQSILSSYGTACFAFRAIAHV
jgi:hypothetical protein